MKIVVNALSARLGGGQTYIKNLLFRLPKSSDLEVFVFAPPSLELTQDPRIRRVQPIWPVENPLFRTIWEKILLPRYLRKIGADLLFCPGGVVATRVTKNCQVVTMFRNMLPFDNRALGDVPWGKQRLRNWILKRVMLKSMASADLTIFISNYARAIIEKKIVLKNAITIPHGVSSQFRPNSGMSQKSELVGTSDYLLYVSRFESYKHHFEVVLGYSKLSPRIRKQYPLILAGETDLPDADRVYSLVKDLKLEADVKFVGSVPYADLPVIYQGAKAVIFASSCENCPNILLEALASGRPVLSSNVMPMPEFGGDEISYFSPFDPEEISRALEDVLTNSSKAGRLARASVERSLRYDWEKTAEETWDALFTLHSEKQSAKDSN